MICAAAPGLFAALVSVLEAGAPSSRTHAVVSLGNLATNGMQKLQLTARAEVNLNLKFG
jgi:hypothetical protein